MDVKTGLLILGEFALLGAVIYCHTKEKALLKAERALGQRIKTYFRNRAGAKEIARRKKINKRAAYTPMKPPCKKEKEKAA
jgi:hypothetical protein